MPRFALSNGSILPPSQHLVVWFHRLGVCGCQSHEGEGESPIRKLLSATVIC
jgi:hypothetical protein